jgi:hypothetical protein
MHLSHPSPGTTLGGLALFIALGGTALAATGTIVNIADPTSATHVAHVDAAGKLEVGDGSGPLTVDGTVTAQTATPVNYSHAVAFGLVSSRGCVAIATAPTNKALIVREIRVDVFNDPSPGPSQNVQLFAGTACNKFIGDVNPATVGHTVVPFDPGIGIPAGSGLSAAVDGAVQAEAYTDGYLVASSLVPALPTGPSSPPAPQRGQPPG